MPRAIDVMHPELPTPKTKLPSARLVAEYSPLTDVLAFNLAGELVGYKPRTSAPAGAQHTKEHQS
jgi:hypothetical protein